MRHTQSHKRTVRQRIVEKAAESLRLHGLAGVSIPALMKRAGLTHGGFYAHFESRDALVAEAVTAAAAQTGQEVFVEGASLTEAVGRYLSPGHLKHPEQGCVLAALGTDGARQAPLVREAFARVAQGFLRHVDTQLRPGDTARRAAEGPSDRALQLACAMLGAVVLGRLVNNEALAQRLLAAAQSLADEAS